jgi:hypothetical protein
MVILVALFNTNTIYFLIFMLNLFNLKNLFIQFTVLSLFFLLPIDQAGDYWFLLYFIALIYFFVINYKLVAKLVQNAKLKEPDNGFWKNKYIPFLCICPIPGFAYFPYIIFKLIVTFGAKLKTLEMCKRIAIGNIAINAVYFVYIVYSIIKSTNVDSDFTSGFWDGGVSFLIVLISVFLIGVLVQSTQLESPKLEKSV